MKITVVFVSNYLNHHQLPVCNSFLQNSNVDFYFVSTEPISEERISLGYSDMHNKSFVINAFESKSSEAQALSLCNNADVVIIGSASSKYVRQRISKNKLTFLYSERLFKSNYKIVNFLRGLKWFFKVFAYGGHSSNGWLLCAGAYVEQDYRCIRAYKNRAIKWGYFPSVQVENNSIQFSQDASHNHEIQLLWCGRLLKWKHPEYAISVVRMLKKSNFRVRLKIIGNGPLFELLESKIKEDNLEDNIVLTGPLPPEKVYQEMRSADVFLFTSGKQEGWGAVLNEAMASGCCVIASESAGSTNFLISNDENGYIYHNNSMSDLVKLVRNYIDYPNSKVCQNAMDTISKEWNAAVAVDRLLYLIMSGMYDNPYVSGPCTRINKDNSTR